jgi:hypothetical protein
MSMQRNYEIKTNKQELEDGFEQEDEQDSRPTSLYLYQEQLDFLDSFREGSRSENVRRIIDYFRQEGREVR